MKDEVIRLWKEGLSSGLIARELNITRNQVMGHIHRAQKAGLVEKRAEPKKRLANPTHKPKTLTVQEREKLLKPVKLKIVETPVKPVIPPPPPPPVKESKPKSILQLEAFDCRWILGKDKYCGKQAKSYRAPWCDHHYQLVYVKGTNYRKRTV